MSKNGRKPRKQAELPPELMRRAADDLQALIDERLPLQFESDDLWGPVAHAFIARGTALVDSITTLVERGRIGEAQMLVRCLFEHVTVLCWLAIDPTPNLEEWRQWCDARRLKMHKDALSYDITVLSTAEVEKFKSATTPKPMPELCSLVDDHWSENSDAFRPRVREDGGAEILTFTGFYVAVYRKCSNLVHADLFSVDRFVSSPLPSVATAHARERRVETNNDYPGFCFPLMGFMLIALESHFGWPKREVVDSIVDGILYEE